LADDAIRRGEISRRHRRDLMDLYRSLIWGASAVALSGVDEVESVISGLKRLIRDELLPLAPAT
jgi:hypothetical protein